MLKSKFSYITYPFFGTYITPSVDISFDKVTAALYTRQSTLKISNSSDFLEELLSFEEDSDEKRFKFRITAQTTQELIMLKKRCVWGIDITGRIHNLKRREEFAQISVKPKKIINNKYIWFREITRPIVTPLSIKNIEDDIYEYWFNIVYIDQVWELRSITPEKQSGKKIWI